MHVKGSPTFPGQLFPHSHLSREANFTGNSTFQGNQLFREVNSREVNFPGSQIYQKVNFTMKSTFPGGKLSWDGKSIFLGKSPSGKSIFTVGSQLSRDYDQMFKYPKYNASNHESQIVTAFTNL